MPNHNMGSTRRREHRKALIRRDGNCCQECGRPFTDDLPPTFEHRTPVSQGGTSALANLELICDPCREARNSRAGGVS
jgi:5-methylcytosine-specific restriction endonuclease McrA